MHSPSNISTPNILSPGISAPGISAALDPSGINTVPGSADDGWVAPPTVTLKDGTRLQLFKDGEAMLAAFKAIERARFRICLEVYILRNDGTGQAFSRVMCEKARSGVLVYFIYDCFGCSGARRLIADMKAAGVKLAEFHPTRPWECKFGYRPWSRDHRKILLIDDDIAGIGGLNIGDEYGGDWVTHTGRPPRDVLRDTGIGIVGPSARPLLPCFAATWRYVHTGGRIRRAEFLHNLIIPPASKGNRVGKQKRIDSGTVASVGELGPIGYLGSVPTLASPLRPFLYSLLSRSSKTIRLIMAYFAPDDDLVDRLCDAARRGVDVRLIFASSSDHPIMTVAARSFYEKFLEAGVRVFEREGAMLHAKSLSIDGRWSLVGSTNLDYRSIEFNLEISCLIDSTEFTSQIDKMMDHDIRFSSEFDSETWRKRAMIDRLVQWTVSRLRYLL